MEAFFFFFLWLDDMEASVAVLVEAVLAPKLWRAGGKRCMELLQQAQK